MGSISYEIPYGSTAKAEVAKYVRENLNGEVVASNYAAGDYGGMKWGGWGGTYYAAVRNPDGEVWALIVLFGQYRGDVCIKALDETVNPTAAGVGASVLKALTPLSESLSGSARECATAWRADAERYQERRKAALAARGKVIELAKPIPMKGGWELDKVEVVSLREWRTVHGSRVRPLQDWFVSDWKVA